MKKHLIAAAVAAAVAAPAMAQVTVYGRLDTGYSVSEVQALANQGAAAGASTKTTRINGAAGLAGNRLGFRGDEDLGGGLKAGFVYEFGTNMDNGTTPLGSVRQAHVTLSGGFGSINVGRNHTIGKNMNDGFTAFGGGGSFMQGSATLETSSVSSNFAGDIANTVEAAVDRHSNLLTYTSPNLSGFTAQVQYAVREADSDAAASQGKTTTGNRGTAIGLRYVAGPLEIGFGYTDHEAETEGAPAVTETVKATQLGAKYTVAGATLFGLINKIEYTPSAGAFEQKTDAWDVGIAYPIGALTLKASYGKGDIDPTAATNVDVKGHQFQGIYALSKRTSAYGIYGKSKVEGARFGDADVMMFGIAHTF